MDIAFYVGVSPTNCPTQRLYLVQKLLIEAKALPQDKRRISQRWSLAALISIP